MKKGTIVYFITNRTIKQGIYFNKIDGKYVIKSKRGIYRKKLSELATKDER